MSTPVERVLAQLPSAKKNGSGWVARCPAHEDRNPSLSIGEGEDGGVLLYCHAGCSVESVTAALGMATADLFPAPKQSEARGTQSRIVESYPYVDEDGRLLFEVCRMAPKGFRQRRPDGKGGWVWSLGETRRVLYHLPQLLSAVDEGRRVFVVEGEKDVHQLEALGFVGTTNPQGAGKWRPEYTEALAGAHVVILPDNDDPGRKHAHQVAEALSGVAADVCVLVLPDLPNKGDFSDWVAAGGTAVGLKELVQAAPEWQPPADAPVDTDTDADTHPPGAKKSTADRLVELGRARYDFGQSLEGDPYGVPKDGPRIARVLRGQGGSLRADLAAAYLETFSKTPTQSALADAVCVLEGLALRGPREPLYVRNASHDGAVWVDLGDATGRAVQVTASGWTVEQSAPVLFRRSALTGVLPEPVAGDLREWRHYLNVTDETWALLVGCLVSTLHPDVPHPVLALTGEQGSAKSTTARQYIELVDPSAAPLRTAPRDIGEWVTVAAGSAVIGLDNVSHISSWLSDALCRAVTGEGFPRRQLYSDGDIVVTAFRRAVVLNGIDMGALSGDLVDRAAFVELQRIPKERRRLDTDLARDFAAARPALFGGLLDLVAATLYHLPAVKLAGYPRMADHAKVLAALDMAADLGALPAFLAVAGRAFEEAVDGDQVAAAVRRFAETHYEWSGELADLLETLTQALRTPDRPPKGWPPDAARLSGRLKRAAPALRALGVAVELGEDEETRHRTVTISRERAPKTACLPCEARGEQALQAPQAEIGTLSRDLPDAGEVGESAALFSARESQADISGESVADGSAPDRDEEPEPFTTTTEADGSRLVSL